MSRNFNKNKLWKEYYKYIAGKFLDTQTARFEGQTYDLSNLTHRKDFMLDYGKYLHTIDSPFIKLLTIDKKQIKYRNSHKINSKDFEHLVTARKHFRTLDKEQKKLLFLYTLVNAKQGLDYAARDGMSKFFDKETLIEYNDFIRGIEHDALEYSNGKSINADKVFTDDTLLNFLHVFASTNPDLIYAKYDSSGNTPDLPEGAFKRPTLDVDEGMIEQQKKLIEDLQKVNREYDEAVKPVQDEYNDLIESLEETNTGLSEEELEEEMDKIQDRYQPQFDDLQTEWMRKREQIYTQMRELREASIGNNIRLFTGITYTSGDKVVKDIYRYTEAGYVKYNNPFDLEVNMYSDKTFLPLDFEGWDEDFTQNIDGEKRELSKDRKLAAVDLQDILKGLNSVFGGIGSFKDEKEGLTYVKGEGNVSRRSKFSFNKSYVKTTTKLSEVPEFVNYMLEVTETNSLETAIESLRKDTNSNPYFKITLDSSLEDLVLGIGLNEKMGNISTHLRKKINNAHTPEAMARREHKEFDTLPQAAQLELINQYKCNI